MKMRKMGKKISAMTILGIMLLLLLLSVGSSVLASPSQVLTHRFDARGGVPGPPDDGGGRGNGGGGVATTYELFIEVDYMEGHAPTQAVLDYIEWYYNGNNPSGDTINVMFYVNDTVPSDSSVSDTEFWAIEAAYNNMGDDKYTGESANFVSKWKWVLFGTTVEGDSNVMGYTYVLTKRNDLQAGNYIFIADESGDDWSSSKGIADYGAEAVVLMHEMGHSIGIAKLHPLFGEKYDPDPSSVMSYLSTVNAGLDGEWYYSDEYWATRNMKYYD